MIDAERYGRALAGAALGGGLLGLADAGLVVVRAAAGLSGGDAARLLGWGALAGLAAGLVVGGVLGLFFHAGRRWGWAALLGLGGLAAAAIDGFAYRNLYPEIHALVGGCALLGLAAAGAVLARRPWGLALGVPAAVGLTFLAPLLLGDGHRLRQVVLQEGTISARVLGLLPEPEDAAVSGACEFPAAAPVKAGPRVAESVLLITVDALRADLGPLARFMPQTAAALGPAAYFPRAYVPATRTTASVYSILTGRWHHRLEFRDVGVDPNDTFYVFERDDARLTDPKRWKQRQTVPITDRTPTLAGLLKPAGVQSFTAIPYVNLLPNGGTTREFTKVDEGPYLTHNRDGQLELSAESTTDAALSWLGASEGRRFVWLHYLDPHHPYRAIGVPENAVDRLRYLSEIRHVDGQVARLLGAIGEHTLVILTSDHGEEFGDHGGKYHGTSVYEEQLRVPLWIKVPGAAARTIEAPVSLVDLAPTVVDLMGVPTDVPFDGRSLRAALAGAPLEPRPILGESAIGGRKVALVEGDQKLIVDFAKRSFARFDLAADPQERHNLIDADPELAERLRCRLGAAGVAR